MDDKTLTFNYPALIYIARDKSRIGFEIKPRHALVVCIIEGTRPKTSNKRINFLNLLVLVHLKNYFIETLNRFLMCSEINGLKNLNLAILRFFAWTPQLYILLYSSKKHFYC